MWILCHCIRIWVSSHARLILLELEFAVFFKFRKCIVESKQPGLHQQHLEFQRGEITAIIFCNLGFLLLWNSTPTRELLVFALSAASWSCSTKIVNSFSSNSDSGRGAGGAIAACLQRFRILILFFNLWSVWAAPFKHSWFLYQSYEASSRSSITAWLWPNQGF